MARARNPDDLAEAFSSSVKEGGLLAGALDLLSLALKLFETQAALGKQVLADLITIGEHGTIALAEYFLGLGKTIAEMFKALAAGLPGFFSALVAAGREAVHAVGQAFSDLGTVIHDTLTLDFSGAKAAFGNLGGEDEASLGKIRDAFSGVFDFSKAEASATGEKSMSASSANSRRAGSDPRQRQDGEKRVPGDLETPTLRRRRRPRGRRFPTWIWAPGTPLNRPRLR